MQDFVKKGELKPNDYAKDTISQNHFQRLDGSGTAGPSPTCLRTSTCVPLAPTSTTS